MAYTSFLPIDLKYKIFKYLDYLDIYDKCKLYKDLCNDEYFWLDLANDKYGITENQFEGQGPINGPYGKEIKFNKNLPPYLRYLQIYLQVPVEENGAIYHNYKRFIEDIIRKRDLSLLKFTLGIVHENINIYKNIFIYIAALVGDKDIVDYFLTPAKEKEYQVLLKMALDGAIEGGHLELIDHLLKLGAKGDVFSKAATDGQLKIVKEFYNRTSPSINKINDILKYVYANDVILFLLSKGGDPSLALPNLAQNGNLKEVKTILENNKIKINVINNTLLQATIGNHLDIIEYLLNYSPTNIDDVIQRAIEGRYLDIVKLLLPFITISRQDLFDIAIRTTEDISILDYLYNKNINLNLALIEVSEETDNIKIFKWLINHGANNYEAAIAALINGQNSDEAEILELLLSKADIADVQDIFDNLDQDLWQSLLPIFVEYGVDIDQQVNLAVENDNDYLANLLLIGLEQRYEKFGTLPEDINYIVNRLKTIPNLSKESRVIILKLTKNKI